MSSRVHRPLDDAWLFDSNDRPPVMLMMMILSPISSPIPLMICRSHQRTSMLQRGRCGHLYRPGQHNTNMLFELGDQTLLAKTGRCSINVIVADYCRLK